MVSRQRPLALLAVLGALGAAAAGAQPETLRFENGLWFDGAVSFPGPWRHGLEFSLWIRPPMDR